MKHKLITITALAAALSTLASCRQEEAPSGLNGPLDISLEIAESPLTKVDVNGNTGACTWTAGDKIAICVTGTNGPEYQEIPVNTSAQTVHVDLEPGSTISPGYSVSPFNMAVLDDAGKTGATPTVKYLSSYSMAGKDLTSQTFSYVPMMAVNNEEMLSFYHVGGLLRLILNHVPEYTEKITVEFVGMSNICGTCTVTNPGTGKATTAFASDESNKNVVTFTNVKRSASTMYLNVPLPSINFSALTAIRIEAFDGSATPASLGSVSKTVSGWGTLKHGYGRLVDIDFTGDILTGVRLNSDAPVTLWKTQTAQRTATGIDDYGRDYNDVTVVWSTSDGTVATVNSSSGLVTGAGAGTCTITATATPKTGGTSKTASYTVNVNAITEISLADSYTVKVGGTKAITAELTNTNNGTVTSIPADLVVSWVSDDPTIVSLATGVASATTTPVRVDANTMTASVIVNGLADGSSTLTASVSTYGSVAEHNTVTCVEETDLIFPSGGEKYLFRGYYIAPGFLKYEGGAYSLTGELDGLASLMAAYGTAAARGKYYFTWDYLSSNFKPSEDVITGTVYEDASHNEWRIPTRPEWATINNGNTALTTKIGIYNISHGVASIVVDLTGSTLAGQGLTTDGIASAGTDIADGGDVSRTNYIAGALLIPDGAYITCSRMNGYKIANAQQAYSLSFNCITYDDLEILVNKGCVFLPTTGYYNSSWKDGGTSGKYWSATLYNSDDALYLHAYSSGITTVEIDNTANTYLPVRLIRN